MRRVFYGMAVCGSLLSSCVVPNLGGVVDAVGRETTVVVPNNGHPKDLRVYELDNAYYVEVQATWQHVSARCFHSWDPFQGSCGGFRFWEQHDASAPKEIFLQRLSAWEVEHLLQKKVPEASGPSFVPQAEFDYTRAKLCKPRPKLLRQYPDDSKWAYGEADDYYGSGPAVQAAADIRARYEAAGLSSERIEELLVLDIKPASYFTDQGFVDQHGGGAALFARDAEIMGWLFGK